MRRNPIVHGRLRRPVTPRDAMTIGRRIGESRKWTRDPERFEEFRMGLSEELEHRDVTHGRALTTGRIARAHLNKEDPRYYSKLKDMMAKRNPISGLTTGDKVWIHGEQVINPYKVVEDRGDRVVIRGFVHGFNAPDTYTIDKGDIFRISRTNPRPQGRVGFIGYYNELGYRICKMVDGRVVAEVYSAGNSPADSQQTVPVRHGVGLRKIKEWAEQTGREIAEEAESAFFGIEYEESE